MLIGNRDDSPSLLLTGVTAEILVKIWYNT
jgi:hypothetical protein